MWSTAGLILVPSKQLPTPVMPFLLAPVWMCTWRSLYFSTFKHRLFPLYSMLFHIMWNNMAKALQEVGWWQNRAWHSMFCACNFCLPIPLVNRYLSEVCFVHTLIGVILLNFKCLQVYVLSPQFQILHQWRCYFVHSFEWSFWTLKAYKTWKLVTPKTLLVDTTFNNLSTPKGMD